MAKKDKGAYAVEQERPKGAATTPRLKQQYLDSIVPALKEKFNYKNPMMVPKLEKIVINMGVGEGSRDIKVLDAAMDEMTLITGQRPNIRRAKKSIANFKIREEMPLGCSVTLRGARMYEFLDRFINIACPRIRDFRGLPKKSFDGRGNYNMGLQEQLIFMEIDPSSLPQTRGMNLTAVTSAKTDAEAMELLKLFGMPFREN